MPQRIFLVTCRVNWSINVNATDLPLCSVLSSLVIPLVRKLGNLQKATVCYVTSKYTTLILNPNGVYYNEIAALQLIYEDYSYTNIHHSL